MKNAFLFKTVFIILVFSFTAQVVHGQVNWTVKNVSNSGLVNNKIMKIFQAKSGDIWIGTSNGLNIIRGENWDTFTISDGLPNVVITDIIEVNNGNIWVATLKGIAVFDGKDISIISKEDGLVNNVVYSIESDSKGNIWVGTKKGVSVYDGQNWKTYTKLNGLISNWVSDIMEDMNGNMWFATQRGVSVFDGVNWKSYNKTDGLARNVTGSIAEDSSGEIWFGNYNGKFSSYDGSNWENIQKGSGYYNFGLAAGGTLAAISSQAAFQLGTGMSLGPLGIVLIIWGPVFGALPSQATFVYIDSNDNIWLAAQPKGVFMFDGQNWMQYTKRNGLPHKRVNSFLETRDGAIWFGTLKGIAIMNK